MQSGPHWERQNGLPASSGSACGVALLATGVGLEANFSGLRVVCGSCLVASSGSMERRPICPEIAGARWKKRAIVPHMHHPVLLLRPGRPAVPLQRAHFAGGAVVACHFLATAYHRGKERQGYKRNGVQPAREATSGLAGCICSKSVPMTRSWQGQVAVSQVRHAVLPPTTTTTARPARAHTPKPPPPPPPNSTQHAGTRTAWHRPGTRAPGRAGRRKSRGETSKCLPLSP
jgi:hypothetical protein